MLEETPRFFWELVDQSVWVKEKMKKDTADGWNPSPVDR